MATARKTDKQNLRFILETIHLPQRRDTGLQRHVLAMELVWPRTGIARRANLLTVPLVHGLCATDAWSLTNKLCFKETCEHDFGLKVTLSEPITASRIKEFLRFLAGKSAHVAASALEDAVTIPVADELSALPLLYLSRELLADQDPDMIAQGALDLRARDFADGPVSITVPLTSLAEDRDQLGTVTFKVEAY